MGSSSRISISGVWRGRGLINRARRASSHRPRLPPASWSLPSRGALVTGTAVWLTALMWAASHSATVRFVWIPMSSASSLLSADRIESPVPCHMGPSFPQNIALSLFAFFSFYRSLPLLCPFHSLPRSLALCRSVSPSPSPFLPVFPSPFFALQAEVMRFSSFIFFERIRVE